MCAGRARVPYQPNKVEVAGNTRMRRQVHIVCRSEVQQSAAGENNQALPARACAGR